MNMSYGVMEVGFLILDVMVVYGPGQVNL